MERLGLCPGKLNCFVIGKAHFVGAWRVKRLVFCGLGCLLLGLRFLLLGRLGYLLESGLLGLILRGRLLLLGVLLGLRR